MGSRITKRETASLQHVRHIAGIGSFKWNPENGHLQWSDEVFRILGLHPEIDVASQETLMKRVHPDDRERFRLSDQDARAGQIQPSLEYRIVRPNGQIRYLIERYEADSESDGQSAVVKGNVQDLTEDKALEERTRYIENVKAMGNLTGSIADEFNNLLFVVLGNLELLEDCVPQDSDILQLIDAARRGLDRKNAGLLTPAITRARKPLSRSFDSGLAGVPATGRRRQCDDQDPHIE